MYQFEIIDLAKVNVSELDNFDDKNAFTTYRWLHFIQKFRKINAIVVRISDDSDRYLGYFTGCLFSIIGIKIIGSPFYGWMGQHMGFDLLHCNSIDLTVLLDEIVNFLFNYFKVCLITIADFKFDREIYDRCKTKHLFDKDDRQTYFLDLTKSEDEIFENFKSGYRTCVRKFEKLGGKIIEEQSDNFIIEHQEQLNEVFGRKSLIAPDYSKRLSLLFSEFSDITLAIKANDTNGKCIATSYYIGAGKLAFFASNASQTEYLYYNANQALMWYAIKYWKSKGMKILDLGGSFSYKANFGATLKGTPLVAFSKHPYLFKILVKMRDLYYFQFAHLYKLKNFLKL